MYEMNFQEFLYQYKILLMRSLKDLLGLKNNVQLYEEKKSRIVSSLTEMVQISPTPEFWLMLEIYIANNKIKEVLEVLGNEDRNKNNIFGQSVKSRKTL